MNETERRIRALERATGTGWAALLFCDERPTPEQLAELEDHTKRGIRQLIFFAASDSCWLNMAGAPPPWEA